MPDQETKKAAIKPIWLRIILFGLAFAVTSLIFISIFAFAVAGASLETYKTDPSQALAKLLGGDLLWVMVASEALAASLSIFIFWKYIDRRSWIKLGLNFSGFGAEALMGLLMGPALLGIAALLLMLSGHLTWVDLTFDGNALFISLGMMLLVAVSEELIFRGYILTNCLDLFQNFKNNKWIALGVSSILFAIFHLSNPGINPLAVFNLILAGFLLGLNYVYTRNLWFSIAFHFSWNYFQGPILGFKVSGLNLPSLLQLETKGDMLLTGGDFGLEGSMLNTAVSLTAIFILAWAFEKRYGSQEPGAAAMA